MARANPEEVAKRVRDAFAAYDRHDLKPYLAMIHPDFVINDPSFREPLKGKEVVRMINESVFEALPDLKSEILSISTSPDVLAVELKMEATFKGPLRLPQGTVPPTGRHIEFTYIALYRFNSDGLLTEVRNYGSNLREHLGLKA
jgi:predicted ester cyclase